MLEAERPPAVLIENVVKSYKSNVVLQGFDMYVEEGTIYGLLGPSGCGKTTVLGCLVGTCGVDSGQIQLCIKEKTQLGYMPQGAGLFHELTSEETFYFHGRINLMTDEAIKSRIQDLIKLLDLPSITKLIKNISGGEQRRISLAVALLHDPRLLLLDEPTVGLDSVLRHNIWEHLKLMVAVQNKTVLITTHYIEEARFAHTVGFMLDGVLLEEDSPQNLMQNYSMNSLEEIFLHLTTQRYKYDSVAPINTDNDRRKTEIVRHPLAQNEPFSFKRLEAQLLRNITWMMRNYMILIYFVVFAPILYSMLAYETIGRNPTNLKIGVAHSGANQVCANQLTSGCDTSLDCRLIQNLETKSYQVVQYSNELTALGALQHNKVWAVISFPVNFTSSLSKLSVSTLDATDALVDNSLLNITVDRSNSIIASLIKKHISESFFHELNGLFLDCGLSAKSTSPPIIFEDPIFGKHDIQFTAYIFPGLICMFPFMFACVLSMTSILMEKLTGVIERSMVAGLLWSEFLIAHMTVILAILVPNVVAPYFIIFGYYKEIHAGHYLTSYVIIYLQGVCGMCCGILIASVCNVEAVATQTLVTIIFVCTYATGGMWPVEGMHWIVRLISFCLPTTIPLESVRHVIDRGWSITYFPVLKGVLFSVLWSLFFLLLAAYIMYRKTKLLK